MRFLEAALLAPLLWLAAASTEAAADDPAFDRFIRSTAPFCMEKPSTDCAERNFAFLDADGDGALALEELEAAHERLLAWHEAHAAELAAVDRNALNLGLWIVGLVGVEQLFTAYDLDGSGGLSLEEATADLHLDDRPLPELVVSADAINWSGIKQRLGRAATFLDYIRPQAEAPSEAER